MSEMHPDVIEQQDAHDGAPQIGSELPLEAPEADALEQAQLVGDADDDDYR